MASKPLPFLGALHFQVRFGSGYAYFDRCGQTLLDIERDLPGWMASDPSITSGTVQNVSDRMTVVFGPGSMDFTAERPGKIDDLGKTVQKLWSIIAANLGIRELVRVGARFEHYLAAKSTEDAERLLQKATLNIQVPPSLSAYTAIARQPLIVLLRGDTEYRIVLQAVTRTEGAPASGLVTTNPRLLAKNQREARIELIRQQAEHRKNPEHAIQLDSDCAIYEPQSISARDFLNASDEAIRADFLPLLTALC